MDLLQARTHLLTSRRLCGEVVELAAGRARVELETLPEMAVDERGLVHGGFVFGLADYAAMLAVNDPYVVLGAAETRFLLPVEAGERLEATAVAGEREGRRVAVEVVVRRGEVAVMGGRFACFVLEGHVLDRRG